MLFNILLSLSLISPVAPANPVAPKAHEVIRSQDGGRTWTTITSGLNTGSSTQAFWAQGRTFYLANGSGLYQGSQTIQTNWQKIPWMEDRVRDIFPGSRGLYFTGFWGGLYQQTKATGTMSTLHQSLPDKIIHTILETRSGQLLLGCETGIYRSVKRSGEDWQKVLHSSRIHGLVEFKQTLLASNNHGLWRSVDDGAQWRKIDLGQSKASHLRVVPAGVFAILTNFQTFKNNTLVFSPDEGTTWKLFGSPADQALNGVYDFEQAGAALYVCSKGGIFRSDDQGKSWQRIVEPPADRRSYYNLVVDGTQLFVLTLEGC